MTTPPSAPTRTPLFPLHTVLYPGGVLPLRIFEPRYVDMVRDCLRDAREFGVVPITHGGETGTPAEFHPFGTLARIETFDQGADGLLHLLTRGTRRFRVGHHEVGKRGLIVGEITPLGPPVGAPPAFAASAARLLAAVYARHPELGTPSAVQTEDAGWLAYRWAELLPLVNADRVRLLEMDDGAAMLELVLPYLPTGDNGETVH